MKMGDVHWHSSEMDLNNVGAEKISRTSFQCEDVQCAVARGQIGTIKLV